jgi:hypothetical protein
MPYCGRRGGPPSTKIVDAAKSDPSIGVSIGEKPPRSPHIGAGRLCGRAGERNFSFVNVSPRRLLLRRGGFEGARGIAARAERLCKE